MSLSCYVLLHNKYNSYTGFVSENNPAQLAQIINLHCVGGSSCKPWIRNLGRLIILSSNLVSSPPALLCAGGLLKPSQRLEVTDAYSFVLLGP